MDDIPLFPNTLAHGDKTFSQAGKHIPNYKKLFHNIQKTLVGLNIKRKRELTRVPHFLGMSTKPENMEGVFRRVLL